MGTEILSTLAIVISFVSLVILYHERKSTLRSVVYEKQIEACYVIMMAFSDFYSKYNYWKMSTKHIQEFQTENPREQTYTSFYFLSDLLTKYHLILPQDIFFSINEEYNKCNKLISDLNDGVVNNEFDFIALQSNFELQNKIREYFGIEKLSTSSQEVIHHSKLFKK